MRPLWLAFFAVPFAGAAAEVAAPPTPPAAAGTAAPATTPRLGEPIVRLPDTEIIGTTPLLGSGVDRNKVPAATQVLTPADINRTGVPSLIDALATSATGVSLGSTSGNPFQPDILFRGFIASPEQGNPQGLAVYVNGVRFNQPLGDTVNWDLIPPNAIERVNVESSKPQFGLNALGGSVTVRLKNGFDYQGGEAIAYGGSYGRGAGLFQYGKQSGETSAYFAAQILHDGGFRQTQSSDLRQFYGDVGWRGDRGEVHANVLSAFNNLENPGATPESLLNIAPSTPFTAPNTVQNHYVLSSLNATYDITDETSLQGVAYVGYLSQRVVNGVTTDNIAPCNDGTGALCTSDLAGNTVFVTDRSSNPIPDFLNGGNYSGNTHQGTDSTLFGTSAQVTNNSTLFGHANNVIAGFSFDGGNSVFNGNEQIGGITTYNHQFIGPGITIDQADNSPAPTSFNSYNRYYGLYVSDLLNITPKLVLSASGRLNIANIRTQDQIGTALNGNNTFTHFNPGVGLTYTASPAFSVFASYAVSNRAPTPIELSCANPLQPCQLASFFVSDPPLKQVVSDTYEVGVRGKLHPFDGSTLTYALDFYRSQNNDDIISVTSPVSNSLSSFQNAGQTRRQGLEATLGYTQGPLRMQLGFAYTNATFQTPLTLTSPNNPGADPATGTISVKPGDTIPGIPQEELQLVVDYKLTPAWTVGMSLVANGQQYLYGDQANLTKRLPADAVLSFNTSYQLTRNLGIFGLVTNVTDQKYYTYGTFGPVGAVPLPAQADASNTRVLTPSQPVSAYGGVRVTF